MSAPRGVHSVAKAGINQLTCALAVEWGAKNGIRVNGIALTTTRTPRAMVGPALFLASPMSDFVSGQTIAVDGGQLAGG